MSADTPAPDERSDDEEREAPAPGPADHGGSGGMATRELGAHGDDAHGDDAHDDETD
ncbi:hypothetical protein [Williamsia deligens]|uniref:Uncharacterized protein n=1 Tax=Williamsia deligens TaxID=321325 RepID=A0ABW3GAP9_9NOCA|nr:hypothetical protein [Williamsia deligens]MCP2195139.1 hypothetical protein [Williamsia deligens]